MFHNLVHVADQVAILPDSMIQEVQSPTEGPSTGYGIGWEIDSTAGVTVITHSGDMPASTPGLSWCLRNSCQSILANGDDRLSHIVADQILHPFVPSWKNSAVRASSTAAKDFRAAP